MAEVATDTATTTGGAHVSTLTGSVTRALKVGSSMFVNFEVGQVHPARTRLRGWAQGRFLLLDDIGLHDAPIPFKRDALWNLKYVAGGYVCATEVYYLGRTASEMGCVYVTFPQEIHVHSTRRHERRTLTWPVRYLPHAPDGTAPTEMIPAQLINISLGGCAMIVEQPFVRDARVTVAIPPMMDQGPVVFTGTVRHCEARLTDYVLGIQFDPPDAAHLAVLDRLLSHGGPGGGSNPGTEPAAAN